MQDNKHPHKSKHIKIKCTLCSLSLSDNNIPLMNISAYSQANLSDQNIICLLDSGADVDYVDSNLIEAMHLNNKKYIITCINCLTCSGVQNNCHPILGLINPL